MVWNLSSGKTIPKKVREINYVLPRIPANACTHTPALLSVSYNTHRRWDCCPYHGGIPCSHLDDSFLVSPLKFQAARGWRFRAVVPAPVLHARIPEEALLEGSHGQQRVTNAGYGVSRCCPGKDPCSVSTLRDSERVHFLPAWNKLIVLQVVSCSCEALLIVEGTS